MLRMCSATVRTVANAPTPQTTRSAFACVGWIWPGWRGGAYPGRQAPPPARGWRVEGPLPADTLFFRAVRGDFDLVVAMYHDQGHGPVKVLGLEAGVNITVGLPVIRTSVDHGTAFDIPGKGLADERSMLEALRQAIDLAPARAEGSPPRVGSRRGASSAHCTADAVPPRLGDCPWAADLAAGGGRDRAGIDSSPAYL